MGSGTSASGAKLLPPASPEAKKPRAQRSFDWELLSKKACHEKSGGSEPRGGDGAAKPTLRPSGELANQSVRVLVERDVRAASQLRSGRGRRAAEAGAADAAAA